MIKKIYLAPIVIAMIQTTHAQRGFKPILMENYTGWHSYGKTTAGTAGK
jgi:hypothetical protein